MHVLLAGFVRIRHYGPLANRHRQEELARCREFLGAAEAVEVAGVERMARPAGWSAVGPTRACPVCGAGRLVAIAELPAMGRVEVGAGPMERVVGFDTS
jgi:hypothetical protein